MIPDLSLDDIACQMGTDKCTRSDLNPAGDGYDSRPRQGHGYTIYYEHYLRSVRQEPLRMLEIGVLDGKSLATWEKYLPNAKLYGLDLDPSCIRFENGRTKIFIGSQADQSVLDRIGKEVPEGLDVIIDDGSHYVSHIMASFNGLFRYVKPGGLYIIEDVHIAAWIGWGKVAFNRGMEMAPESCGNDPKEMLQFLTGVRKRKDVFELSVYLKKICFIRKASQTYATRSWDRGDRLEDLFPVVPKRSLAQRIAARLVGL